MIEEGTMVAYAPCIRCGHNFTFNPATVPSTSVCPETRCNIRRDGTPVRPGDPDAVREPLCPICTGVFRASGGADQPLMVLFPRARVELIDVAAALRIQAGGCQGIPGQAAQRDEGAGGQGARGPAGTPRPAGGGP